MAQQLNALQQQLLQIQQQLNAAVEEKKQDNDLQYKGKSMKVKLTISDKQFITNTDTLFNKHHGNTLFIQTQLDKDKSVECNNDDNKANPKQSFIELEFQRNPNLFQYIIDFLTGYNLQHQLRELTVVQLEQLQFDAAYYQIQSLHELVTNALYGRFNPYLGSPLFELSKKSTVATRSTRNAGLWQSTAIYGTLVGTGSRYVEINIITNIDKNIVFGVTEAATFQTATYPGERKEFPGCGYRISSGYLYRSGSSEAWGASSRYGDRVGALVKLNKESNMATIAFYKNGKLINKEANLKNYMNVDKGVIFVVSMYNANEQVQIVQNPTIPQ